MYRIFEYDISIYLINNIILFNVTLIPLTETTMKYFLFLFCVFLTLFKRLLLVRRKNKVFFILVPFWTILPFPKIFYLHDKGYKGSTVGQLEVSPEPRR